MINSPRPLKKAEAPFTRRATHGNDSGFFHSGCVRTAAIRFGTTANGSFAARNRRNDSGRASHGRGTGRHAGAPTPMRNKLFAPEIFLKFAIFPRLEAASTWMI